MQKKRLAQFDAELELRDEPLLLIRMRRIVAVEIQTAFAERDATRLLRELPKVRDGLRRALARVVRMHARRGIQHSGVRTGERGGAARFFDGGAGDDDLRYASAPRARKHLVEIRGERRVREVGADIDKLHAGSIRDGYKALRF